MRPDGIQGLAQASTDEELNDPTTRGVARPSPSTRATRSETSSRKAGLQKSAKIGSNSGVGKRLLNVEEAAQYLGLQVETVYKKARLRELPYVKVGRALRFDVEALERFIAEHTIETID